MEDFYRLCEEEFLTYDKTRKYLYTETTLQEVCLGIHSMCLGAENKYFNGATNITDGDFLCFGVKGLMDTNKRLKDAMLFNILSFMTNQLLGIGNTSASIDELYLFLSNLTAIEYIRNAMKRVRKKDSVGDFVEPEHRGLSHSRHPRVHETVILDPDASVPFQRRADQPQRVYGRAPNRAERIRTHQISGARHVSVPLRERAVSVTGNRAGI